MRLKVKLFVLLLTIASSTVYACGPDYVIRSTTRADGTNIGIVVHVSDFDGIPVWIPNKNDLPLPPVEARELALEWAKTKYSRYDSVEIPTISIELVGLEDCDSSKPKYLYVIEVLLKIDGNPIQGVGNWVAVFMDGTIVGTTEMKS